MKRDLADAGPITIRLNRPQHEALTSTKKKVLFVAGLGVGKSVALGFFTQAKCRLAKGSFGLLLANTKEQLRDSTWPRVQEAWERMGVAEGAHYVVGRKPPGSWGVRPWNPSTNSNIVTFRWGTYLKLGSVDNFNTHRGPQYDYIAGDEWRDWKRGAVEVLVPRLRGEAFKVAKVPYQIFLATTPPDDPDDVERYFSGRDVCVVRGTTMDNALNLPDDYLETLQDILDEHTYRREVLGELIPVGGARAYYAYDESCLLDAEDAAFDRDAPETYLCCDFNVGEKPMAFLLLQLRRDGRYVVVREFVNKRSNTDATSRLVEEYLDEHGFTGELRVVGDYAGKRRESSASQNDYLIISSILTRWTAAAKYRITRRIRNRVACLNAMFRNTRGKQRLWISRACKHLIADLRMTEFNPDGVTLDDTNPERTHPSDALSYWAYNYFNLEDILDG